MEHKVNTRAHSVSCAFGIVWTTKGEMTYLTFTTDQQKCTLSAEYHIRKVWYPASLMLWMQGGWDAHMIHVCSF